MNIEVRGQDRSPVVIQLPNVLFPVQLAVPTGFDPGRRETWPRLEGRLEYVEGRLLYVPPTGGNQSKTVFDVALALGAWAAGHPEFVVGANEAGMKIGDDVRAADIAIWRTGDIGPGDEIARKAPVLAIEVAGRDDTEEILREKAAWYGDRGVDAVWLVIAGAREVIVRDAGGETRD